MGNSIAASLPCLECGRPTPSGRRWLCSDQCFAVMRLIRYGRRHQDDPDDVLDEFLLRRWALEGDIDGSLPTQRMMDEARRRDHGRCQYPGCGKPAAEVDYRDDDPGLQRKPRLVELRTLCSEHHLSESRRRFVGPSGRVPHSAPATWARIEAEQALVLRDDHQLWLDRTHLSLLRSWPLSSNETRADLERWVEALQAWQPPTLAGRNADPDLPLDRLNAALDSLDLPRHRQERLVRAIQAIVFAPSVEEGSAEGLRAALDHHDRPR
jgi:hypothetical protein